MKRRDFLRAVAGTSFALPVAKTLGGCAAYDVGGAYDNFDVNFDGHVTVIGAGAAGLAAGYLLQRYGIDFEVLEASDEIGGRTKRTNGLADFPIDLGAEWIHAHPSILAALIDDRSVAGSIDVTPYSFDTAAGFSGGRLHARNWAGNFYGEHKFKSTTWFGYLERYFASGFSERIRTGVAVTRIDHSGDRVVLETADDTTRETDRVILTVPIKVLQDGLIEFTPELPGAKREAIDAVVVPDGMKAFFKFERRFYPDVVLDGLPLASGSTDHLLYDAARLKETSDNVLGIFSVGDRTSRYAPLDDVALRDLLVEELDEVFDGKASRFLIDSRVQNWSAEPYVRGAYATEFRGAGSDAVVAQLQRPLGQQVWFAGEALSSDEGATVHGAMLSGYKSVEQLLAEPE